MEYLVFENRQGVMWLTINRPRALNALNKEVLRELDEFLAELKTKQEVRVLVLKGAGEKAFVAGADIREMKDFSKEEACAFAKLGHRVFGKLGELNIPTIACMRGYALGGGLELALGCDLRIAGESVRLGQPETGLGIIPGFGGTQRLARLIGPAAAFWLIYTGDTLKAEKALEIGLVNMVVGDDELEATCADIAGKIAAKSPVALRAAKRAISEALDTSLADGLARESDLFASCFATGDPEEGMAAFLEKRLPKFPGI